MRAWLGVNLNSTSGAPPSKPIDVVFTIRSIEESISGSLMADKGRAAKFIVVNFSRNSIARFSPFSKVLLAMDTSPTSLADRPAIIPRAAPPAPIIRTFLPLGSKPASSRSDLIYPLESVLCPISIPSLFSMVLTEPIRDTSAVTSSRNGITFSLWGIVTFTPQRPKALIPFTAAPSSSGLTPKGI